MLQFIPNFIALPYLVLKGCYADNPRLILHNASYITSPILRSIPSHTLQPFEETEFKPDPLISISLPRVRLFENLS